MDLYRYHASATAVIGAGVVTGIVFTSLDLLPAWGAFLVGAVPVFAVATVVHAVEPAPGSR